jgi:hypothetical protein
MAHRFDYLLPLALSNQHMDLIYGSGKVGLKGSVWFDPASAGLLRMEVHATEIPEYLPLDRMDGELNFAGMRIGESTALLPQEAWMRVVESTGEENYDRFGFTHCSEFRVQSAISFDAPAPTENGGGAPPAVEPKAAGTHPPDYSHPGRHGRGR